MPFYTPLRYPGGKRRLLGVVTNLLKGNDLSTVRYFEPFAGGASLAYALLFNGTASEIHLNDLDRGVYAFWHTALHDTKALCERIMTTPVTMDEWYRQRSVYDSRESAALSTVGFATLFLNRTNRSGIIGGGVIGGKQQAGAWTLGARFNKEDLVRRIWGIAQHRDRIHLYCMDAQDFLEEQVGQSSADGGFVFLDPPYIAKGLGLYLNNYTAREHRELAKTIRELKLPWLCTYDQAAVELGLYEGYRRVEYELPYTAQSKHTAKEIMFLSSNLTLPAEWRCSLGTVRLTEQSSSYELHGVVYA